MEDISSRDAKPPEEGEDLAVVAPVVQLVNQAIIRAVKEGATDIHLEPKEKELRSRFRIDGILHEGPTFPKNLQAAITTRIKIMANLNISESRLPQDGKIIFPVDKKHIDLRVSTLPNIFGENIALRILDKEKLVLGLEQLGFSPHNLSVFRDSILKSHGIILVCGPTGSGKTTTLYSALSYVNSKEKNIVTLEDPVEYELPELCQSQINLKQGFTFAGGLRAILRQDPDIIFVGEMRDAETVEAAMRAAITGHLVFSTLHTNDAVGAIARLLDMGVEPYLLSSSLVAILGQRLVRCICPACKERVRPEEDLLKMVGMDEKSKGLLFYQGKGCDRCYGTGYKDRIAIFEILPVSSSLASLIAKGTDSQTLKNRAKEEGMTTMME
ncbi:MAG: GspE/PulE family protein, partial [Planctomycetota bacterium]